ncbi:hypothetical protein M9H77_34011 [Catharanthus roseus]|uniref:Uncharacterized protein n=1 Tax=Catharanthus roseus TaxID=4058 RepID=A0ACB9ZJX8_CATRO|nr:hypothetical protein M9H77_34011 [Catharanthus roseus]
MAIGSVMYSMISTRPDIAFSISLLSRFMSNSRRDHWAALKWLLRDLNGILYQGLHYHNWSDFELIGFADSDFAGDKDGRKSTTSYFFTLASNCISWKSQQQSVVALTTIKAEYIKATEAIKEAIWLQGNREGGLPVSLVIAEAISEGAISNLPFAYSWRLDAALSLLNDRSSA